jgi:N-hydroxyarylamine O-acetyltransferase
MHNKTQEPSALISSYLNEMNIQYIDNPSVEFLFKLTVHHMLTFGWDTIDLYLQRKISLEPETIIAKFLKEQRGGICYETAIAFCYLLNNLGFNAYLATAYTHGYNDHVFSFSIDTHVVIIVAFEEITYLVDVSWDPPKPILITNMSYFDYGVEKYRLRYVHLGDNFYLEKYCSNAWKAQYSFQLFARNADSFYNNLKIINSQSEFDTFKKIKIMKLTQSGAIGLFDKTFIISENGQQTTRLVENFSEIKQILKQVFAISPEFVELYLADNIH